MTESDRLAAVTSYLEKVARQLASGQATEHSYRPALKALLGDLDETIEAINEPKQSEHGAPDFVIIGKKNRDVKLGYGEAKDIGVNLDKVETSEQMNRYKGYANLFLTDCLDWRFYRNGEKIFEIKLGELNRERTEIAKLYTDNYSRLADEIANFLDQTPETITNGKRLAAIMGGKARRIRDNVSEYLHDGDEKSLELVKMFEMMQRMLVHDLTEVKFADMYAQTLVYGLFVARYGDDSPRDFTRAEARDLVPKSNPFLRHFFDHIVGPNFDTRLGYIVDELCEIFAVSDVQNIVHKHLRIQDETSDAKDPIIHFYEDFLQEYDPAERKKMGAYYTPTPVVKYIVRQVDRILREDFGLSKGLASTDTVQYQVETGQDLRADRRTKRATTQTLTVPRVQILDPAVGTATFLNETIKFIHKEFEGQEGRWPSYVNDNLLKRLHGFELMMAPYTIAHLKLGMTLKETGVDKLTDRLGVYLTNTLEEGVPTQGDMFTLFGLAEAVADESRLAAEVKNERPVMVVMGNPPYSASSSNRTKYANSLVDKYKVEPGGKQKLQEKKHWLNDDYVKFIAFAEDMIEKNGTGIVAMITNNGYLDNASFRGMRWHLAKTFDKMYVLDLHGNSKKKEVAPDGGKDVNVFDIQQGVSIILAVRTGRGTETADVMHADMYGIRDDKFKRLLDGDVEFDKMTVDSSNYYFIPKDTKGQREYEKGVDLNDLMPNNVTGIVSGKDRVTMFDTYDECREFVDWCKTASDSEIEEAWGKLGRGQTAQKIRNDANDPRGRITPVSYRPFEVKYTYYTGNACGFLFRPRRKEVMGSLIPFLPASAEKDISFLADFSASPNSSNTRNIGLSFERNGRWGQNPILLNSFVIPNGYSFSNTASIAYTAPLYIYHEDGTRTPNFAPAELSALTRQLTKPYEPEDILDYTYAILHSPSYREKYKEFLKIDFPRVPVPTQTDFDRLVPLGHELRQLHLMKSSDVDNYATTYPVAGDDSVEKITYQDDRVYINATQYFGNVPETAWNFYIGGYQPAQKWLKDRKGRELSSKDLDHYQRIIRILLETDRIMKEIT